MPDWAIGLDWYLMDNLNSTARKPGYVLGFFVFMKGRLNRVITAQPEQILMYNDGGCVKNHVWSMVGER